MPGDLATTTEQDKCLAQPLGDLNRLQVGYPGGGELERKRNAVEAPANLHNGLSIVGVESEPGPHVVGPVDKEPDRGEAFQTAGIVGVLGLGEFKGWYPEGDLARHVQRLAARR